MKAYDFDGTLYRGDSSIDFYLFCLKNNPRILKYLPLTIIQFLLYRFGRCSKKEFKQCFFVFYYLWKIHNKRFATFGLFIPQN